MVLPGTEPHPPSTQLCTVTFSGPGPEDFHLAVSCFVSLHFKYSMCSTVRRIKEKIDLIILS